MSDLYHDHDTYHVFLQNATVQMAALTEEQFEHFLIPVELISNALLFVLVFGMSATVRIDTLTEQLSNQYAIAVGVLLPFFVLPFLGFLSVKLLKLDETMAIPLLIITSSPGGSYSNWWCSLFNADLALSVTMTTVSTFLSIAMLPINLFVYAHHMFDADVVAIINWGALYVSLAVVIAAILSGLYCSATVRTGGFHDFANKMGNAAGVALVLGSIVVTTAEEEANLLGRDWVFYVGVAAPCVVGLVVAHSFTTLFVDMKPVERVTVSVECCYQNVGIATSVSLTMFRGDRLARALGVPLYYGVVEAVVLGIFCAAAWKYGWTKAPKDESFWKVITTSYESVAPAAPPRYEYVTIGSSPI